MTIDERIERAKERLAKLENEKKEIEKLEKLGVTPLNSKVAQEVFIKKIDNSRLYTNIYGAQVRIFCRPDNIFLDGGDPGAKYHIVGRKIEIEDRTDPYEELDANRVDTVIKIDNDADLFSIETNLVKTVEDLIQAFLYSYKQSGYVDFSDAMLLKNHIEPVLKNLDDNGGEI